MIPAATVALNDHSPKSKEWSVMEKSDSQSVCSWPTGIDPWSRVSISGNKGGPQ